MCEIKISLDRIYSRLDTAEKKDWTWRPSNKNYSKWSTVRRKKTEKSKNATRKLQEETHTVSKIYQCLSIAYTG